MSQPSAPKAQHTDGLADHPLLRERWYHSIELAPGVMTPGHDFDNIALTRQLLQCCDVQRQRCLDIGAMDALISLVLERRGAGSVVAYDRQNHQDRIALLRQVLGARFTYVTGMALAQLRSALRPIGVVPFDVVIFSGVLYHMFDPLAGLAAVRGLVRNGGLLVLETSAVIDDRVAAYFNADGRFYPGTNYWQVSLPCLDYLLRFVHLAPMDCVYLNHHTDARSALPICRIGVVCRACATAVPAAGDGWMDKAADARDADWREFVDFGELDCDLAPVAYEASQQHMRALRADTGTVDLLKTVRGTSPLVVTDRDAQIRLKLEARC